MSKRILALTILGVAYIIANRALCLAPWVPTVTYGHIDGFLSSLEKRAHDYVSVGYLNLIGRIGAVLLIVYVIWASIVVYIKLREQRRVQQLQRTNSERSRKAREKQQQELEVLAAQHAEAQKQRADELEAERLELQRQRQLAEFGTAEGHTSHRAKALANGSTNGSMQGSPTLGAFSEATTKARSAAAVSSTAAASTAAKEAAKARWLQQMQDALSCASTSSRLQSTDSSTPTHVDAGATASSVGEAAILVSAPMALDPDVPRALPGPLPEVYVGVAPATGATTASPQICSSAAAASASGRPSTAHPSPTPCQPHHSSSPAAHSNSPAHLSVANGASLSTSAAPAATAATPTLGIKGSAAATRGTSSKAGASSGPASGVKGGSPGRRPGSYIPYEVAQQAEARQQQFLQQLQDELDAPAAAQRKALQADRELRAEQDALYQASLSADAARAAAAAAGAAAAAAAAETAAAAAAEEAERHAALLALKASLQESLPEQPSVGDPDVLSIRVRLPNGSQHVRRCNSSSLINELRQWVQSLDAMPLWAPDSWSLVSSYPRARMDPLLTVGEAAGLGTRQLALFVEQH